MELIKNLKELNTVIRKNGLILYGAGANCKTLLSYIDDFELPNSLRIIAVKDASENPPDILGLPVLSIDYFQHIKEDGLILVTTAEKLHIEIEKDLCDYANVVGIEDGLMQQIRLMCNNIMDSADRIIRKIRENQLDMQIRLESQLEIKDVHTDSFKKYKNCNRDKDVVIVATGPTEKFYTPINGALHLAVNGALRDKRITFDYYFTQDGTRKNIGWHDEEIEQFEGDFFVGRYLNNRKLPWLVNLEYPVDYFRNKKVNYYFTGFPELHPDITHHSLFQHGSIVFPALHFALFTYPKRIFLVGCDCANSGHFYDKKDIASLEIKEFPWARFKMGFARIKAFADFYYPDTEIISINPIGLKGLFKDIYTDDYRSINDEYV